MGTGDTIVRAQDEPIQRADQPGGQTKEPGRGEKHSKNSGTRPRPLRGAAGVGP